MGLEAEASMQLELRTYYCIRCCLAIHVANYTYLMSSFMKSFSNALCLEKDLDFSCQIAKEFVGSTQEDLNLNCLLKQLFCTCLCGTLDVHRKAVTFNLVVSFKCTWDVAARAF